MKHLNTSRSLGMRTLAVHGGQQPDAGGRHRDANHGVFCIFLPRF